MLGSFHTDEHRAFSYAAARRILVHVQRVTARCREEMEHLWQELGPLSSPERLHETYVRMNRIKDSWYHTMRILGARPRKLWEVDFNSGDGYWFTWRTGERSLLHLHAAPREHHPRRFPIASKYRKSSRPA